MDHLAGLSELARLLDISKQRVAQLADRADFPEPVATLGQGRVWNRKAIEKWARQRKPSKGGRPKKV